MDWTPLFTSLKTASVSMLIALFTGIPAALLVVRQKGKVRSVLDGLFTLPMVLPPTILGFFLLVLFGRNSPIGQVLQSVGIRLIFSWAATVVAATVVAFPLVYRTVRSSFEQIDSTILGAARTLGIPEYRIFFRIMLPMAKPGILGGTVLGFSRALGEFGATLMIAGNIPGRTQTIPIAIYFASEGNNMEQAYLWVGLIVLISFSVVVLLNTSTRSGRP